MRSGHVHRNRWSRSPEYAQVIQAMLLRPRHFEEIGLIAGVSDGQELIADLRQLGLAAPCQRTPGFDRNGLAVQFDVYAFTAGDRNKIASWHRRSQKKSGGLGEE